MGGPTGIEYLTYYYFKIEGKNCKALNISVRYFVL